MIYWNIIKICVFLFNTSVDSHESPTTFSCCNIIFHQWLCNLIWFMNENLFMLSHCLKFHQITHDTTASSHQQIVAQRISWDPGLVIACWKLTPNLAAQMWRHNYVSGRNEYLISTLLESTVPRAYHCNFLFKCTLIHGDMKETVSGCFFLNTVHSRESCRGS